MKLYHAKGDAVMSMKKTVNDKDPKDATPPQFLEEDAEDSLNFFVGSLKHSYPNIYNNLIYLCSLLARAHTTLGPVAPLFRVFSVTLQKDERTLLCEISDRIVLHRYEGEQHLDSHVVLGWTPLSKVLTWLLKG